MKSGTENRKKTIIAGALIAAAVIAFLYMLVTQLDLFSSGPKPAPPPPPASSASENSTAPPSGNPSNAPAKHAAAETKTAERASAGVAATKLATTAASLDPTLDERAMLRTESLVYSGAGRNIFSASPYTATLNIPTAKAPVRVKKGPVVPPTPYVPPPPPTCPPQCPPINLKFFGTAIRSNGLRQAFLLDGEDVYLASQGDIVARKYKIVSISSNSIQVEDLQNHNTQTLPLASN